MSMDILKQNKMLFITLAIVLALFIGYGFVGGNTPARTSLTKTYVKGGSSPIEQETLRLLRNIEGVELNGVIFSDPAFAVLRDFSRSIVNEERGRSNPFAPVGFEEDASSTDQMAAE